MMRMSRPFVSLNERQRIIPLPLSSSRLQRKMVRRLPKACRRLPVCCIADFQSAGLPYYPAAWDHSKPCRLEVGDTAGWKPAVRFVPQTSSLPYRGFPNPQDFPITRQPGIIPNPADLEVGDTAGWKPAVRLVPQTSSLPYRGFPNPQDFPLTRQPGIIPNPADLEVGDTRLPGGGQAAGWKPAVRHVPQTSSLPYRGFPNPQDFPILPDSLGPSRNLPTGSRRHSRLETCGTASRIRAPGTNVAISLPLAA